MKLKIINRTVAIDIKENDCKNIQVPNFAFEQLRSIKMCPDQKVSAAFKDDM